MRTMKRSAGFIPAVLLISVLAAAPALADKDRGHDHHDRGDRGERDYDRHGDRDDKRMREHFSDRHKVIVREYYVERFHEGKCPPGLAKKKHGCMPPGHAKNWHLGRPLAREVVYYEVPRPLVVQIGVPPPGYRYVRVASDILMIAIGTGMVVDAIQDLHGM
jgi:Ni/Co efflux regulator RcnB